MELPIYIDDKREGTLSIERREAVTVMTARLRDVGRVVRLTVYGGSAFYLGVPEPRGGELCLTRRFSPRQMRAFPADAAYAAEERMEARPASTRPGAKRVIWLGGRPHYF